MRKKRRKQSKIFNHSKKNDISRKKILENIKLFEKRLNQSTGLLFDLYFEKYVYFINLLEEIS